MSKHIEINDNTGAFRKKTKVIEIKVLMHQSSLWKVKRS